jgi:hypothetical protein
MMGCECGRERPCQCGREPGPGQDVEEQARALAAKVIAKLHIGQHLHGDWPPLQRIADGILPEIEQALRAAQAEAERRYAALKAECDANHPPEPWASELQARVEAAERRAQEAEARLAEADEYTWHTSGCPRWQPSEVDGITRGECDCGYASLRADMDARAAAHP